MLSIVCFVAIGAVFGFLAPLPAFAAFSIVALITYAVFTTGFSGLGRFYDVVFAAVALQVGYFLAILIHSVSQRKRAEIGTAARTQSEHERDTNTTSHLRGPPS
jgi:heme exporter protein D